MAEVYLEKFVLAFMETVLTYIPQPFSSTQLSHSSHLDELPDMTRVHILLDDVSTNINNL